VGRKAKRIGNRNKSFSRKRNKRLKIRKKR